MPFFHIRLSTYKSDYKLFELVAVMNTGLEIIIGHEVNYPDNNLDLKLKNLNVSISNMDENIKDLNYIDIRLPNRIYYK